MTRSYTATIYHPTSTCAMGSCVDEELRVKGVKGLRVIDASIMPTIVSGNTNVPVIMIGEKGADIILGRRWYKQEGWRLKPGKVPIPQNVQEIIEKSRSKESSNAVQNFLSRIKG